YGRSKRAGEEEVLAAGGTVVRTASLYGSGGPNFFRAILDRAARGQALRVVRDQVTAPTWARELAGQLAALAEAEAPAGVYHATAAGETTWYEAAVHALRRVGSEVPIQPVTAAEYGAPAPRPARAILEPAALRDLGLYRMRAWDEAL